MSVTSWTLAVPCDSLALPPPRQHGHVHPALSLSFLTYNMSVLAVQWFPVTRLVPQALSLRALAQIMRSAGDLGKSLRPAEPQLPWQRAANTPSLGQGERDVGFCLGSPCSASALLEMAGFHHLLSHAPLSSFEP